jgi:DNA-binding NarL/FixJ family response regulator
MKVLVADSHAIYRMGMRDLLKQLEPDAVITEADNLADAVRVAGEGPLDLLLVDLQLDGMVDFNGLTELSANVTDGSIIVMSDTDSGGDVQRAVDSGAAGVILKSLKPDVMVNAIRLVLSGGMYLPPSVLKESRRSGSRERATTESTAQARDGEFGLTPRQLDVLRLLAHGKSNKDIARDLELAEGTVKVHISAIFKALNVRNRTQAVIRAGELQAPAL